MFKAVEDLLKADDFSEKKLCKIIADALFNLKISQPKIEYVKKLVEAFPQALKSKNNHKCLPIEPGKRGAKYISVLALEGLKHNVGGENMRGGLLCVSSGQCVSKYTSVDKYLVALKDLRQH